MSVIIGGLYEHYKGKRYKVIGVAKHSETLESLVREEYIKRAYEDDRSVIIRQYCRVIAKFIDRQEAETLIDRIIHIVKCNPAENQDNDETYYNYYGGKNAACQAFIKHLSVPHPKYDAKLHLYLLEHLASVEYAKKIMDVTNLWDNREDYADAIIQAVDGITGRTSI